MMGMKQFGRSVESVIARGDFHWKSPGSRTGGKTCKVDLFQFHALIFETAVGYGIYRSFLFLSGPIEPRLVRA